MNSAFHMLSLRYDGPVIPTALEFCKYEICHVFFFYFFLALYGLSH